MVVRCTALFAHFLSWSDGVWNPARLSVRFWRPLAITLLGKPEIIAIRGSGILLLWRKSWRSGETVIVISVSGIFLLWHDAWRSGIAVVVISASGYSCCKRSVVRIIIAPRHTLWPESSISKWTLAESIYFWRTSAVTCHWRRRVWNARMDSEGTRPALLPAGPVPERWNVKQAFHRNRPLPSG
jgi:hypothetical protein